MILSSPAVKRARPFFGTILELEGESSARIASAFSLAARLERDLSKFNPGSWVSNFSGDAPEEYQALLHLALRLKEQSEGAFDPFCDGRLDLSGIAKGWAVDKLAQTLGAPSFVNAGGDVRGLGVGPRRLGLRCGNVVRSFELRRAALASSMVASPHPSTSYHKTFRPLLSADDLVCAMADECAVADAFTKIVLFAPEARIARLTRLWKVDALVLTAQGEIKEYWPADEAAAAV